MPEFDPADLSSVDPQHFHQLVKDTPADQLKAALQGEHRTTILDEVFGRMPTTFRADRAGNTNAVIHWIVTGGADGADTYEVVVDNGTCTLNKKPEHEPRVAVTLGPVEPALTTESTAMPIRRPSCAKTNFAGGCWVTWVRIGHF